MGMFFSAESWHIGSASGLKIHFNISEKSNSHGSDLQPKNRAQRGKIIRNNKRMEGKYMKKVADVEVHEENEPAGAQARSQYRGQKDGSSSFFVLKIYDNETGWSIARPTMDSLMHN